MNPFPAISVNDGHQKYPSPPHLGNSDRESEDRAKKNKALFLDRDGVVIDYIPYLSKPEQVSIPAGAAAALKQWQDAGYLLIIITNQS
jgi:D-glycero-D-manno-heptose 1,7-bisphosphate phosphatase